MVWCWSLRLFGEGPRKALVVKAVVSDGTVRVSYWETAPKGLVVPPAPEYDPHAQDEPQEVPESALSRFDDPLAIRKTLDAKSIAKLDALALEIKGERLKFVMDRGDFCVVSSRAR